MTRPLPLGPTPAPTPGVADERAAAIKTALAGRALVFVGMMGSGKSAIGQRLAARLGLPFVDADAEIVAAAAGMTIPEIFAKYGERYFRDGERRVIMRLLNSGQIVLATGGGAFMDPRTRERDRRARRLHLARRRSQDADEARPPQERPAIATYRRPRGDAAPPARNAPADL
ncbi:shikimate kinase [Methylocystis sp. IM4]|uniref:shikimate kinase n=1 Tax=Methylocystis sp. IM4 TaxID=3136560 RepID=UPI0031197E44